MGKFQKGQTLIIIIAVVALVSALVMATLMSQQRVVQQTKNDNDNSKFREVTRRLQNILDARALCTCNLKDLTILPNGTNPDGTLLDGAQVMLAEDNASDPEVIGFYKLDPAAADGRGCKAAPGNIDYNQDSVLILRPTSQFQSGIHAKYLRIDRFALMQDVSPTIKRYKANLTFAAKDQFSVAKSNVNSPIDLDVYIEVDSSGGVNKIKQCFQPQMASNCATAPPEPTTQRMCPGAPAQTYGARLIHDPLCTGNLPCGWDCNPGLVWNGSACVVDVSGCAGFTGEGECCSSVEVGYSGLCFESELRGGPNGRCKIVCVCRRADAAC